MIDASKFGCGYRGDLENHASLAAGASPFHLTQTYSAPKSISHRAWRKPPKNQGNVGACSGFSRASGEEILNFIGTGGSIVRLSEMYAYLENQRACGLFGRDSGATIAGSLEASRTTGICKQETFPYPGRYMTDIPDDAEIEGKQHLIKSYSVMQSYDDVLKWISSGVGVVLLGCDWTDGLAQAGAKIEMSNLRGRTMGGHALILEGMDENGYIDLENSWGDSWGDGGWSLVSPDVIEHWAKGNATLIGISDLESYGPRPVPSFAGVVG